MSVTTFISLPEDLHIRILAELNGKSIIRCAMTCKTLYETLRNSLVLEYRIQLYLDGLEDAGTSTSSASSLISDLRRYREACFTQEWSGFVKTSGLSSRYDNRYDDDHKLGGGVISVTDGDHLEIVRLPNAKTGEGLVTIEHNLSTEGVTVFCMDPTQDVMAILERVNSQKEDLGGLDGYLRDLCIYIRTLSTNTDHPLANTGVLWFADVSDGYDEETIHNPKLEISDDNLVLWTCDYTPRVIIWDWKTGECLRDLNFNARVAYGPCRVIPPDVHDFGLLGSSDFAFLTRPTGCGSIEIYRLAFRRHLATLNFPSYTPGTTVKSLTIKSYNNSVYKHQASYGPFLVNNEEQIYVFEVEYEYSAIARNQPLADVPWNAWGPANTAIDILYPTYGPKPIHGQRVICRTPDDGVEMKDFTLSAVLAADGGQSIVSLGESKPAGVLIRSNTIRAAEVPIFLNDVEGRLPYVSYLLTGRPMGKTTNYSMVMMCEEGVVCTVSSDDDDGDDIERNQIYIYSPVAL
ncbi:hypothetical protein BDN70DRAFT_924892 [Pholiota conissans]|uniref:F-box domain-containing protein n=1 Tax=Pholiota conissans TaxID=109636 RepID=A0A9P6CUJ9_9AGAR|nr:hypothetical protein BDN70DRAFT_924892 [Pholiota conissans]